MLRYPDGKREQISLPEQAKLLVSGVNWNPCVSTGELKLENFFSFGGSVEIRSSRSGVCRDCLHCQYFFRAIPVLSSTVSSIVGFHRCLDCVDIPVS